jgi:hypothetical protein
MSGLRLIPVVQSGDVDALRRLIAEGGDLCERDEHGWTPLAWAAGRGDIEAVRALIAAGAEVASTGRDNRTPLSIAKAAGRAEVAEVLTEAEQRAGVWKDPRETVQYCKAYLVRDLRAFVDGGSRPAGLAELGDDDIVYVHQDLRVTRSMWHGEDVLIGDVTPAWRAFCEGPLGFAIPDDLL